MATHLQFYEIKYKNVPLHISKTNDGHNKNVSNFTETLVANIFIDIQCVLKFVCGFKDTSLVIY